MQVQLVGSKAEAERLVQSQLDSTKKVMESYQTSAGSVAPAGAGTQAIGSIITSAQTISPAVAIANAIKDIIPSLGSALAGAKIESITLYPNSVVSSNGGTELATGGVIPPGYPNDTYPAMLTSGETVIPAGQSPMGDMSAFAAAIVNAINRQTDALTSNSGINAPYWS